MRSVVVVLGVVALLATPALAQLQTVVKPVLPDLPAEPDADTSPMVCREPQLQTDSRLPGPRVCKTQKQWDALHAQGLDVSADGAGVVASEKYRRTHPSACGAASVC